MGGMYVVGQAAKVSGGFTGAVRNVRHEMIVLILIDISLLHTYNHTYIQHNHTYIHTYLVTYCTYKLMVV